MSSALIGLAVSVGAPLVSKIIARKIGAENSELVTSVIESIAQFAGVTPDAVEGLAQSDPDLIRDAISATEAMSPALISLYTKGLEYQMSALQVDTDGPLWMRAWRPGGMYLLGFLWLWNVVVLHSLNAIFKIALPPIDVAVLFQLTAVYLGLYMGGHTVKDVAARKWGKT
ncbi:hypothetical protein [Maritimibacter sp. HL-12]|uniref:hypothetical protein n=1 Tax=Maritimibacter sp. HL-12 TaxID=1162418 RepID=UPI000A0F38D9|nr:hypothetical protein [Maritimibacter sp. HL-12]SMH35954.1 hypothetical protein SAMN05661107_0667 [Maritimibacter sp. HL-12]